MRLIGCALVLALGLTFAPHAGEAQQADKVQRIGLLGIGQPGSAGAWPAALLDGLRDLGWIEGKNLILEDRRAPTTRELESRAAELAQLKVDVIFARGTPATRAAKQTTTSIPVVMVVGVDPVADGLVASLPRPGANVTGVTGLSTEVIGKRLSLVRELVPRANRIAYMWNSTNPGNVSASKETLGIAEAMGLTVQSVPVRGPEEFNAVFASMAKDRIPALVVGADDMLLLHRVRLAALAATHHIPAMYSFRSHAEAGDLMVYGADWNALYRRVAVLVDKILKGAKPGELPLQSAEKFELAVNLKTAKALNLTISEAFLLRADELIE